MYINGGRTVAAAKRALLITCEPINDRPLEMRLTCRFAYVQWSSSHTPRCSDTIAPSYSFGPDRCIHRCSRTCFVTSWDYRRSYMNYRYSRTEEQVSAYVFMGWMAVMTELALSQASSSCISSVSSGTSTQCGTGRWIQIVCIGKTI